MTTTFGYPGVFASEQLQAPTPASNQTLGSPSVAAFLGEWWRGPTVPVMCNNWNDFVTYFGGFNTNGTPVLSNPYLGYAVYEFFSNGGATCWVSRLTNSISGGTSATVNLLDSEGGATPQATLTLTVGSLGVEGNAGTWGNDVYVNVTPSNNNYLGISRFNISVYYNPAGTGISAQTLVETWADLSMVVTDARYVVSIINSSSSGSRWIFATDLFDAVGAPQNVPIAVTTALMGGTDSLTPSNTDYVTALTYGSTPSVSPLVFPAPFDNVGGQLNINVPGMSDQTVLTAAIGYAADRPSSFLVIDPPIATTPAALVQSGGFIQSLTPSQSSYCAVYYPWLSAQNPASASLLNTIMLPPGGFILGQMAQIDVVTGPWVAPAGTNTVLRNVVSAERAFAPSDLSALTEYNVNALRTQSNGTVLIWGTRTQNQGFATKYVPVRRTLDYIEAQLTRLLEYAIFQPNDAQLWQSITGTCNQFLGNMLSHNAFPSSSQAASYYVICSNQNNTAQSISQGIVNTEVGVALLYPAEFISLTISQFQTSGATTVTPAI